MPPTRPICRPLGVCTTGQSRPACRGLCARPPRRGSQSGMLSDLDAGPAAGRTYPNGAHSLFSLRWAVFKAQGFKIARGEAGTAFALGHPCKGRDGRLMVHGNAVARRSPRWAAAMEQALAGAGAKVKNRAHINQTQPTLPMPGFLSFLDVGL